MAARLVLTRPRGGYAVDYYPSKKVTVDFYRNLPTRGYDLIVLRVHSARINDLGVVTDDVSLFTSEPLSGPTDSWEMSLDLGEKMKKAGGPLRAVGYADGADSRRYVGIPPAFVESSMRGSFEDTTVIMMGCDGVRSAAIGKAFVEKGAGSFISWDQPVSNTHTDAATERLLQHLVLEGLTTEEAVTRTMAEVGPDRFTGAQLRMLLGSA